VAVVTARVHLAVRRAGVGLASLLDDRQRIHVRAQADAAAPSPHFSVPTTPVPPTARVTCQPHSASLAATSAAVATSSYASSGLAMDMVADIAQRGGVVGEVGDFGVCGGVVIAGAFRCCDQWCVCQGAHDPTDGTSPPVCAQRSGLHLT